MKNPDIVYSGIVTDAFKNRKNNWNYRLTMTPAFPEKGPAYAESYTIQKFPLRAILDISKIDSESDGLPIGPKIAPALALRLNLTAMDPVLRATVGKPDSEKNDYQHLPGWINADPRFSFTFNALEFGNVWIFESDRGSNKATWHTEFAGIQRKMPGTIGRIRPGKSEIVEIELRDLTHFIMESTTFHWVVGFYLGIDINTKTPYDPALEYHIPDRLYQLIYSEPSEWLSVELESYTQEPILFRFSDFWEAVRKGLQDMARIFLRSDAVTVDLDRHPQENMAGYKSVYDKAHTRGALLGKNDFYFMAYVLDVDIRFWDGAQSKFVDIPGIAGGLLDNEWERNSNDESWFRYENFWNFFKEQSKAFASKLDYGSSISIGVDGVMSGNCFYKFRRIYEDTTTRTEEERTIDVGRLIGQEIEYEQGAELIRAAEVHIDSARLKAQDQKKWKALNQGVRSEQKYEVRMAIHNVPMIPPEENLDRADGEGGKAGKRWIDRNPYVASQFYYKEEALPDVPGTQFVKIHEDCGFYLTKDEEPGDDLQLFAPSGYPLMAYTQLTDLALAFIQIQQNSSMPYALGRLLAQIFGNPNQTLYKGKLKLSDGKMSADHLHDSFVFTPPIQELSHVSDKVYLEKVNAKHNKDEIEFELISRTI